MKTRYKYIHFTKYDHCDYWDIETNNNPSAPPLGIIEWYSRWKQWCFTPNKNINTIFNVSCLADIIDFIKQLGKKSEREIMDDVAGEKRCEK